MRRNLWKRAVAVFGAAVLAAAAPAAGVLARGQSGSVTLELHGATDNTEGIPLERMDVHLALAARPDGDGGWTLTADFAEAETDLDGESAADLERSALELYACAMEQGVKGQSGSVDAGGEARFSPLEEGLYLIWPEGDYPYADERDSGVFRMEPFLLTVPVEIDGQTSWDVRSVPKIEWIPDAGPQEDPPGQTPGQTGPEEPAGPAKGGSLIDRVRTGDPAQMSWYGVWILVSAVVITDMIAERRRRRV